MARKRLQRDELQAIQAAAGFGNGLAQLVQDAVKLDFAIAGEQADGMPAIDEQADPVALAQEYFGQGDGGADGILEQTVLPRAQVGFLAGIQHQADISNLLLLKFPGKELVRMAGGAAPIEPTKRIARVILAHTPKLDAASAQVGRNGAGGRQGVLRFEGERMKLLQIW